MLTEELSLVETTPCINQMDSIKKNQLYFTVVAYKASYHSFNSYACNYYNSLVTIFETDFLFFITKYIYIYIYIYMFYN